ncbi:roadblock/LC7 domain-containing protein [Brasilonema sp. UFV-L1]|uniref:roadblock/LC7 domain-containing protein n=1 Tax=Brasilonema sp. UFV-L1 TaxID=2234130 RepID=UPI00145D483B|nr:roadblock/LC7 domain-containing protein [Brasilonema sp. UFV-L1]NMG09816.1 diacylglyceryl transferase [Brasilonema sp. UFV-L1]
MAINTSKLYTILQNFVSSVKNVQGAIIVSSEGLPLVSYLPSVGVEDENVSALSTIMSSIGENISSEFNQGVVEQIYVESEKGLSILSTCGVDAMLFVITSEVNKGVLLMEIQRIIPEIKATMEGRNWGNYIGVS